MKAVTPGIPGAAYEQTAYRWVAETPRKLTAAELEVRLARHFACPRATARRVVRTLIARGRLGYVYLYGQSYIDLGFRCPTPITDRVVLYPPECTPALSPGQVAIVLSAGAAFGDGRHPTTRLAVEGLETIWFAPASHRATTIQRGIDIGTGSGILAIAAVRFGVTQLDALDIDPCALDEARRNVDQNHLGHRITLNRQRLEDLDTDYDLILANLRLPTLCALAGWIGNHTRPGGRLVLSGFRASERDVLRRAYPAPSFQVMWSKTVADWGAAVWRRA